LIFKKQSFSIQPLDNPLFNYKKKWAIFTGTIGPNNKTLLYDGHQFIKIATTTNAKQLLENESQTIEKLNNLKVSFQFPELIKKTEASVSLSDISKNGKRLSTLSPAALASLTELYQIENQTIKIKDWDYLKNLKANFYKIKNKKIPNNIVRKVMLLLDQINPEETIKLSFSHGDFTQWNMYTRNNSVAIYDWELATNTKPKGFDFFHFIIQNGVLVNQLSWKEIYNSIQEQAKDGLYKILFNDNQEELKQYLKWYLLINCLHYLDIYARQKDWHVQIHWLFNVWNEGLNTFLTQQKSSRELIIMDLFDYIHNKDYAALKFPNELPESVRKNSDIDLIIQKPTNKTIVSFLKNHALVSKINTVQKSYMNSIHITSNDDDFLSIDLIWQLKIKNIEILNTKKILKTYYTNTFGVKNASELVTARYVCLFYVLNNATIPKKYLAYEEVILQSNTNLDNILKKYYSNSTNSKKPILIFLNSQLSNTYFYFIKNTLFYGLDTLKQLLSNRGYIITFSGVDGAGKTTIIENIAFQIEKQLRKPVVVLRHRPSIFPILSVWTKGKEKAHLDTISNLPRQGNNVNFWSSLFRFFYYYMDYLLGQFVIYFKYISKGKVVIYDRYYFDFINDCKRSNIVLDKKIIKFGYHFLMKPKFNFFLYANARIILNRKQELDESTINQLTYNYKMLFEGLQSKSKSKIYKAINNEDLNSTLNQIIKTIISH
jgi:thymidylate kinase